jgi:hypothetical protein
VLRDLLEEMDERIANADAVLDPIRGRIDTSVLDRELDEIRERHNVIAHTYDAEGIAHFSNVARERLDSLTEATRERAEQARSRSRFGIGATAFLLVACVGTLRLERDLRRRNAR